MRNIPVFTTEYGVASLVLKEIPYRETAYVTLQSTLYPEQLVAECRDFCRAAGAEKVYCTGHPYLEAYPYHTAVLQMRLPRDVLPDTDAALFPVTEATLSQWQEIYNRKMENVPNASYMDQLDMKQMLRQGSGYFIHRDDQLLGIGMVSGEELLAVASVVPGSGEELIRALNHAMTGDHILLEVASENLPAMRLYQRMGFLCTGERSRWYKIL